MKLFAFVMMISTSFVFCAQKKVDEIKFKALMDDTSSILLDVRTAEEYNEGHIKDAQNINYFNKQFVDLVLRSIPKDKKVLVYCAAGGRSAIACDLLKKEGYKFLYDLEGGYDAWKP